MVDIHIPNNSNALQILYIESLQAIIEAVEIIHDEPKYKKLKTIAREKMNNFNAILGLLDVEDQLENISTLFSE